jgi:PAS domain S-box-containing protein
MVKMTKCNKTVSTQTSKNLFLLLLTALFILAAIPSPAQEANDQQSRLMLEKIMKTAPAGIGMVENRVIVMVNDYILNLTGYRQEELLGQSARMLYPTQEESDYVGTEKYRQIAEKGTGSVETRWLCKGGTIRHVILSSTPLDVTELEKGVIFTVQDVSALKEAQLEQIALQKSLLNRTLWFLFGAALFSIALILLIVRLVASLRQQRAQKEQLSEVTDSVPGVVYQFYARDDGAMGVYSVSGRAAELFGLPDDAGDFFAWFTPRVVDRNRGEFLVSIEKAIREQAPWIYEGQFTKPSGETIWFQGMSRPVRRGTELVYSGVLFDISERKRSEQQLQRQTVLFQNLFKSSPEAIAVLDHEDRVLEINRSFETLFGYSQGEAQGQEINDLLAPEPYRGEAQIVSERVLEGSQVVEKEAIRCTKNGHPVEVSLIGYPLILDQQKIGAYAIYRDISERKRSVEQLSRAHQTLLTILDGIDATVYVADMDSYEILFMNKYIIDAFGGDFTGRLCYQVLRGLSHSCDHCTNDRLLDAQGQPTGVCTWESLNPITKRWYINYDRAIRWHDGRIVKLQIATDITERKQAEEEKGKLQLQLTQAQKMESVGRLAGGVAHDFNNMLGVILGHAELALMKIEPEEPLHFNLEEIKKAAERSADLTRQLLAFARKQTVTPKVLDLNETIESALKMLRRLIGEDIDLAWLPGRNLEPIFIDASQVDQILTNLCVNARDAVVGTGKVTIETENVVLDAEYCDRHADFIPGKYIMLAVSDNGSGMDAETLSHLFEPFFTTKELGKGTGLGLATVYGAVKQNHGFINVYSEPGQGTTFKIYLPEHRGLSTRVVDDATDQLCWLGNETILLVEDEPSILQMTTMMLSRLGYTVVAAATPGEAIRRAREHQGRIDLLMTDVVMPEMNGRELAENLLSHDPDLKRLFMSGYTANVIAHHGVLDEGVHFIQKPFSMKGLGAKLREALDG